MKNAPLVNNKERWIKLMKDKMLVIFIIAGIIFLCLIGLVNDWMNPAVCSFEVQGQVSPSFTGNMTIGNSSLTSMSLGKTALDLKGQIFCRDISSELLLSALKH